MRSCLAFFFLLPAAWGQPQLLISTVAGGAPVQTPIAATGASLSPKSVVFDSSGNMYIGSGDAIYKKNGAGSLTLFAGTGKPANTGDGGSALAAQIYTPNAMALDAAGDLYFTSFVSIRKIAANGTISTVAGSNQTGYTGDGGPATAATFYSPQGIAVDASGNVYVSDQTAAVVRKISAATGTISTFAGNGQVGFGGDGGPATSASFYYPGSLAVDASGNLLILDSGNGRIRQVTPAGIVSTIAGTGGGISGDGGPAASAGLGRPYFMALGTSGTIYLMENPDQYWEIRSIAQGTIQTVTAIPGAVTGSSTVATALAVDSTGAVYFGFSNQVWRFSSGTFSAVAGNGAQNSSGDGGPATNAQVIPLGVALDGAGNLYIADSDDNRVRKVTPAGIISTIAGNGQPGDTGDGGPATQAQISPEYIAVDKSGNVYLSTGVYTVRKVTPAGIVSTVAGTAGQAGLSGDGGPATAAMIYVSGGIAVDSAGNLYIGDNWDNVIRKVTPAGIISTYAGRPCIVGCSPAGDGGPASEATLSGILDLTIDAADNLYFQEYSAYEKGAIRKISAGGTISTVAGGGNANMAPDGTSSSQENLETQGGLAVDSSGNIYYGGYYQVAILPSGYPPSYGIEPDTIDAALVRKVDTTGIVTTIAGALQLPAYTGDGGLANAALMLAPSGLAVDSSGNLYIADEAGGGVRLVQPGMLAPPPPPPNLPTISSVVNSASEISGPVSPGEIVAIYGSNLGPAQIATNAPNSSGVYPTQVGGTSVLFNGVAGPMIYSLAGQVSAIAPYEITGANVSIQVVSNGMTSAAVSVPIAAVNPAIFTAGNGTGQAAAVNQDGTYNNSSHPASAGEVVILFATGEGITSPAGVDGTLSGSPVPEPVQAVTVTVGGQQLIPLYAGEAPGEIAGFMQLNVAVPAGLPAGNAAATVQVGSAVSQGGVTIAVTGQ